MLKLVRGALVCALVGSFAFLGGCKGKSSEKAPEAAKGDKGDKAAAADLPAALPARPDVTSKLWALAPADAAFGVVVGEGVGERTRAVAKSVYDDMASKPMGKDVVDAMAEARKEMGFDPLDPLGWKSIGIDLAKGGAIFVSPGEGGKEKIVVVVPVIDREAFRKKTEMKVETVDGREVDKNDKDTVCLPGEYYVCAKTLAEIDTVLKPHDSKLLGTVKGLPAKRRGDIELWADLTAFPEAKDELAKMQAFGRFDSTGASVRLDSDGVSVVGWAGGSFDGPVGAAMRSRPASPELAALTGKSATTMRFQLPMGLLLSEAPASVPVSGVDARTDLLNQLTGEVLITTTGKGLVGGGIVLGLEDAEKVKKVIKVVCDEAKKMMPATEGILAKLEANDAGCAGELSFDKQAGMDLPELPFALAVEGKTLALWMGGANHKSAAGDASKDALSVEARDMLAGATSLVFWTRVYDFDLDAALQVVPADKRGELMAKLGPALDNITWVASSLAEAAVGVTIADKDLEFVYRLTTFAGDPPEAQAAWKTALEKRRAGDRAAWTAGLTELATKYPTSRVGKRAQLELDGAPLLGPGMLVAIGAGAAYFITQVGEDRAEKMFDGMLDGMGASSQGDFGKKDAVAPPPPEAPKEAPPATP